MNSHSNTRLTSYVESYVEDFRIHLRTFYSYEDFNRKIKQIRNCKRDEYFSLKSELCDMLRARGLNPKEFFLDRFTLNEEKLKKALSDIPHQEELKFIFIKKIYEIFTAFPTPEKFMSRLIIHYTQGEFVDDSLRMKILKIFLRNTNYHTDAVINRIVEKFSSDERTLYESLNIPERREYIISCITEEVFFDNINFVEWLNFVCWWLDNNQEKIQARIFSDNIDVKSIKKILEEKDAEIFLINIEKSFCEFLSKFNLVKDGKIISRKDVLFKQEKITLIKNQADIFNALGINYIGQGFLTLKEYVEFILNEFTKLDMRKQLIGDQGLSFLTKKRLKKLVRSLGIKTTDSNEIVADLLKSIVMIERINSNSERSAVIESLEKELLALNIFSIEQYKKNKSVILIELHEKLIEQKLKSKCMGCCGLELKTWAEFLLSRMESYKSALTFSFSTDVTFAFKRMLKNFDKENLSGIELLKAVQKNFISDKSFIVNKLVSRANRELIEYLKQYYDRQKSLGHIFKRALKDATSFSVDMTLPNLAQDLADSRMKAQGVTKFQLYLLAFALELNRNQFTKMLADIYQENFLRYIDDSQRKKQSQYRKNDTAPFICGESVNYKNYIETILLYFLCQDASRDRLDRALKMIERCFRTARKKATSTNLEDKLSVVFNNSNKLTKEYIDDFEKILGLDEKQLEEYVVRNFYIYVPSATLNNSRIMMNAENNTARKYFLELASIAKTLTDVECGVDIEWLISDLRENDDTEIQKILADEKFLNLLRKLDEALHIHRRGLLNSKSLKDRCFFTRTDLITLYYFIFVNNILDDAISSYDITDIETLYNEFSYGLCNDFYCDNIKGLSAYLHECHFHPLSVTSIFDQFVLFALYLETIR